MTNDAMLQVRIDSELKKSAELLFESIGITFADAVRMFAIQAVTQQCIPFSVAHPTVKAKKLHAQGIAHKYADLSKLPLEKGAWQKAIEEKYADFRR